MLSRIDIGDKRWQIVGDQAKLLLALPQGNSIRELLLVLAVGAVIGTYSSIFIASQFLVIWDRGEIGRVFGRGPAAAVSSLLHLIGR